MSDSASRLTPHASQQFSFEFFPPRTEAGIENLNAAAKELATLNPAYFSCTFGAGGSTQDGTAETVERLAELTGIPVAPHLSCIASSKETIRGLLQRYAEAGVQRIVTLRGDLPSGMGISGASELSYANELVEFIRAETGDRFHLEVAAYPEMHPQAQSPDADLDNFIRKVEAGANAAITQYFYNADSYFDFVERVRARGIDIPITPGIMPITNAAQLLRFSDACGAEIPRWIRKRLEHFYDDTASLKAFGHDVVVQLCKTLLENDVPGLHFYALNRSGPALAVWNEING